MSKEINPNRRALDLLYEKLQRDSSHSLSAYLNEVVIDCVPDPLPFGKIREPWQAKRDEVLVPAVEFVSGMRDYNGPMNFWFNYSKGHDKTSYLARLLNWMLAFAPRKGMRLYCGAKDAEQAAILLDAMGKEANLNKWLDKRIDFKRLRADSLVNGGQLQILTSDAEGNQGKNPDLIVADELTNWDSRNLFDSLYSAVGKRGDRTGRQRCAFIILTNAGVIGSWQDEVRSLAKFSHGDDWYFFEQTEGKPLAGWLAVEAIEKQCRMLTKTEGDRLWRNRWTDPTEDSGAFSPFDIDACTADPKYPPAGSSVFFGLDYGGVHDRTALTSIWYDGETLHVFDQLCWQGSRENEIKISAIDEWIDKQLAIFPYSTCVFDKHQLLATIQRLELNNHKVVRFDYKGGKQNHALFENLRALLQNRKIRFSANAGRHPVDGSTLATELKNVLVKKMSYGYRIDHEHNSHDDRVVSLGMAALEAVRSWQPMTVQQNKPSQVTQRVVANNGAWMGFGGKSVFARRNHFGLK